VLPDEGGFPMIVYYTGTGNSRYCAQWLAHGLGEEAVDAFHFIRDGIAAELTSPKPWIFVSPTYGWRLPRIFADFIRAGSFSGSTDAYFVMTCGTDIGAAEISNRALCAEKGLTYCGTLPVVMPENYVALFDVPTPEQSRKVVAKAIPVLAEGLACLAAGERFPPVAANGVGRLKSGMVNSLFYRFVIKAKAFTASAECIGCGACVRNCVMGNISLQDGRPVWGNRCTHCMACICYCPAGAIEYGRSSVGKPRYQCPPYRPEEEQQ
jgi:ferredoxin